MSSTRWLSAGLRRAANASLEGRVASPQMCSRCQPPWPCSAVSTPAPGIGLPGKRCVGSSMRLSRTRPAVVTTGIRWTSPRRWRRRSGAWSPNSAAVGGQTCACGQSDQQRPSQDAGDPQHSLGL